MYLPISWLKQFVNIKASPQEIAERLTLSGSEVEKITNPGAGLSKIVVGKIKSIEPHPDVDNLQLAMVDAGRAKELKIVCGAKNIKPGQKVPVCLVGGSVPGMKIESREIRGIKSQGMLASARELGIGDDHSGIFILPEDAKIGTDVVSYLELDDPVLELEITPNRPDCFSIRGLAREVSALFGKALLRPSGYGGRASSNLRESSTPASSSVSVKVEDKKLCLKYCARVIQGVNVKESPLWLQNRLCQVGIRPINNIVDITNYVMMELGQPMHAFDLNLVQSNSIIVRRAKQGEKILALDGNKYSLNPDMLVIADSKKPIAIPGIMGGEETSVKSGTQNIILEAAIFNQKSVRSTSKALGLRSESSSRFEKGVDSQAVEEAINLASSMVLEIAGGVVLRDIVSVSTAGAGLSVQPIKLPVSEVKRIIGINVSPIKIKSILLSLGFAVSGKDIFSVKIPSWRAHDISNSEDLIEEIGRMMDYNTLPKTLPKADLASPKIEEMHQLRKDLRAYLSGLGFSEILSYSFYNELLLSLSGIPKSKHIMLTNPVNDQYPYLRASLAPWMLEKLSQNSAILNRDKFKLFEIGKVFSKEEEKWQASISLINIQQASEELYRELRGIIEGFLSCPLSAEKIGKDYALSFRSRQIAIIRIYPKGSIMGMRFRSDSAIAIINLANFLKLAREEKKTFKPIPYYPIMERDLGIVLGNMVQYKNIESAIEKFNPLIKSVKLFDVYHGLGAGSSLAVRITFSSTDRTLEAKEADEIMEKLKFSLEKKFRVNFR